MHQADWHFAPFGWCFRKTARPVVFSTLWMYWCLWSKTFNQTSSCYSLVGGSGRSMGTFASISSATVVGITRFPLLSATQDDMDSSIIHRVLIPKLGVSWSKWWWKFGTYLLYELCTLPFGLSFSECRFTPQREIAPNSYTLNSCRPWMCSPCCRTWTKGPHEFLEPPDKISSSSFHPLARLVLTTTPSIGASPAKYSALLDLTYAEIENAPPYSMDPEDSRILKLTGRNLANYALTIDPLSVGNGSLGTSLSSTWDLLDKLLKKLSYSSSKVTD